MSGREVSGARGAGVAVEAVVLALLGAVCVGCGGSDASGGSEGAGGGKAGAVVDDGPHKLVAPKTVLGGYRTVDGITSAGLEGHARLGVRDAENVQAVYGSGAKGNPMGGGMIQFTGVYGKIADPEKTVDAMFSDLEDKAEKKGRGGERNEMLGTPQDFDADGAVLKCQATKVSQGSAAGTGSGPEEARTARMALCAWADRSTAAVVLPMDVRAIKAGRATPLREAAETTRKLRAEVRVER
ncbi:hypothetical protein GPA10_06610 [Streptomyces sp. p1417]|uniref:Uncharacterized protein n=1 Tax=Streptomyces typhae TaxID=2681492 RepID=A0A6L6WQB5_9ACTN|nr:hypothetical protein [Streptomyces typhae]MVO84455.1 hypothetical protein [Streptomyces typhae]